MPDNESPSPEDLLNQFSETATSLALDKILLRELNDLNEKLGMEKRDILVLALGILSKAANNAGDIRIYDSKGDNVYRSRKMVKLK